MKTGEFLERLAQHADKELVFEYGQNVFVPKAYHITEVKSTHVDSVDCGGFAHSYDETVVQLWISGEEEKDRGMTGEKALKIFNIVDAKKALLRETPIFFEWGFADLRTSVYKVEAIKLEDEKMVVQLFVPPTVCRPRLLLETIESDGAACCGTDVSVGELKQAAQKCC